MELILCFKSSNKKCLPCNGDNNNMRKYLNTPFRKTVLVLPTKSQPDSVIHKQQFQKNIRQVKALCAVLESRKKCVALGIVFK